MQYITGIEAVRTAAGKHRTAERRDGIVIHPVEAIGEERGALRRRLPELYPASAAEAGRMARSAGLYADTYGTPILIRMTDEVRKSETPLPECRPVSVERRAAGYRTARRVPSGRIPAAAFSDSVWNREDGSGTRGIIACGPAWCLTAELLRGSRGIRLLKLGTTWPVPEERLRVFLSGIGAVLVIDETGEELLTEVYALKGKYELPVRILPFRGSETEREDIRAAVLELTGINERPLAGRGADKHYGISL